MRSPFSLSTISIPTLSAGGALLLAGCVDLSGKADVEGEWAVDYSGVWEVFVDGERVARVVPGQDRTFSIGEDGVVDIQRLCAETGVMCPDEVYWRLVDVQQPGPGLLLFENLDAEVGELGAQIGGWLEADGGFTLLAGVDPEGPCGGPAAGTVHGRFAGDHIEAGEVRSEWGEGCEVGGVTLSGRLRLVAPFTAARLGLDTAI
jgi:hypothetical protein